MNCFAGCAKQCLYIVFKTEKGCKLKQSLSRLDRPSGIQVEAPRFKDSPRMKVVGFSVLGTGRLYTQEVFLVHISVKG